MKSLVRALHPAVCALYFALAIAATMLCMQPICIMCSWVGALISWFLTRSDIHAQSIRRLLVSQVMVIGIMAMGNMIFSAHGQTVLFSLGTRQFYAESALYGAVMGCMLAAVLVWFSVLETVLSPDDVRELGSGVFPTVSLMLSMMLAYFPRLLTRGKDIAAVTSANTAACSKRCEALQEPSASSSQQTGRGFWRRTCEKVQQTHLLRMLSVLLGWSLEDSLIQANSMRARGYGSGKRSRFRQRQWCGADSVVMGFVVCFGAPACILGAQATQAFSFYPMWTGFASWCTYIPYAVYMLLPALYLLWLKTRSTRI